MTVTTPITVVYPRFLGLDGAGEYVWELESGRWTFGSDPIAAAIRVRTFEPERYIEKYEAPEVKAPFSAVTVQLVREAADNLPKTRPELGKLEPGQDVMVRRSMSDIPRRSTFLDRYVLARVVKVARVWIDLERVGNGWPKAWRMRRDTRDEGSQYPGSNASFVTMDQYEWDQAVYQARDALRHQGITLDSGSPWRGREIELADILTRASPSPDPTHSNG